MQRSQCERHMIRRVFARKYGRLHALVPLINGVVVDEGGLDLHGAQETGVAGVPVVDVESDHGLFGCHVAGSSRVSDGQSDKVRAEIRLTKTPRVSRRDYEQISESRRLRSRAACSC